MTLFDNDANDDRRSDAALVAAVIDGCHAAFGVIFQRYGGSVHRLARRLAGDTQLADDVTQDVFLWFLDRADGFDPTRGSLETYLLMHCRGRSVDLLRAETSRRHRERTQDLLRRPLVSHPCDVEHEADRSEGERHALRLLGRLPANEREALLLAFFGELCYREVAAQLRIPEGTAKSRIRSGLRRLRHELEPDHPGEAPSGRFSRGEAPQPPVVVAPGAPPLSALLSTAAGSGR